MVSVSYSYLIIIFWDFKIQTDYLLSTRRPDLMLINKKKRIDHLMDSAVSVDHRVKMKENKNIDKFLDLTRELKKLWNMKMTVIPIVVGALGIDAKGLEKRLK